MSFPLVIVVGPTAVGKTQISLEIARMLDGEIVSADSRLIYRGMDIGTAKPSVQQLGQIQHHLINICQPDQTISIAEFQALANRAIEQIHACSRLPILVGGTGQYVHALLYQWRVPHVAPNHGWRTDLEILAGVYGPGMIYQNLVSKDTGKSEKIDWRNTRRVIRALEVTSTRKTSNTTISTQSPARDHVYVVGLTRSKDDLYARIDKRILDMLDQGFIQEVTELLDLGYSPTLPSMSSVGYAQACAYIRGEIALAEVVASMRRDTRRLVRKQYNWFSLKNPLIHWYDLAEVGFEQIIMDIKAWMSSV
jgi:tRNA dimethylallyltransferase